MSREKVSLVTGPSTSSISFLSNHVLVSQTLENDVGGTAHDILSFVSKCKMDRGENKFVNPVCLRGSWTICETFDVLGGLEDISIAKASGLLLPLGGAFRGSE